MIYEIEGICRNCAESVKVLMHGGELIDRCPSCQELPFESKQIEGLIYIVSNPNQKGVKIGLTTKSIESRLKTLNATGVPGNFEPIAIFPSQRPAKDEKKVHEKLHRHNIAKEHFDLDPVDAVLATYRALSKRRPIFFNSDTEKVFNLKLEDARIQMQLRLRGVRG